MSAWTKIVKCLNCGKDVELKSFRKNPGKYVFGKGFICPECNSGNQKTNAKKQ